MPPSAGSWIRLAQHHVALSPGQDQAHQEGPLSTSLRALRTCSITSRWAGRLAAPREHQDHAQVLQVHGCSQTWQDVRIHRFGFVSTFGVPLLQQPHRGQGCPLSLTGPGTHPACPSTRGARPTGGVPEDPALAASGPCAPLTTPSHALPDHTANRMNLCGPGNQTLRDPGRAPPRC